MVLVANVHAIILDLETDKTIPFAKKILNMLNRGDLLNSLWFKILRSSEDEVDLTRPQRTLSMVTALLPRHFFDQNKAW